MAEICWYYGIGYTQHGICQQNDKVNACVGKIAAKNIKYVGGIYMSLI